MGKKALKGFGNVKYFPLTANTAAAYTPTNPGYRSITRLSDLADYINHAKAVAFDFETAPLPPYREEERAALDAHKSVIAGISLSVAEGDAVYVEAYMK